MRNLVFTINPSEMIVIVCALWAIILCAALAQKKPTTRLTTTTCDQYQFLAKGPNGQPICAELNHTLTEREWQALVARVKVLETK